MTLSAKPKFPVFGIGQAYNGGVFADATIEFRGSGLVATAYGFPGFSATLVGTGLYDLRYPTTAIRGMRISTEPMAGETKGPTGAFIGPQGSGAFILAHPGYDAYVSHVGGQSGSAQLNIVSNLINPSGAVGPTGARGMYAPTGAVLNLQFIGSPIARY